MPRSTTIARDAGIARDVVAAVHRALVDRGFTGALEIAGPVVPGATADALFEAAARQLHDDAIALAVARTIPIGGVGTLDYVLCTSATLGDALQRVADHYDVATQRVRLELVYDGDRVALVLHRIGADHSRHWIEFSFAMIGVRIRQTLGAEVAFSDVTFAHAAPSDRSAYDELFGVRVGFEAAEDRLMFDRALIDRPLRTASSMLAHLLEARIRETTPQPPFVDRVRRTLLEMLDHRLTGVEELASRLAMSKRTVQRELRQLGTSFSKELDEIRRGRASALLEEDRPVGEVARRLGFSAPSAFFRAYRRWSGTSPKAARKRTPP